MLLSGLPYSATELLTTTAGGTPYGATHVAGKDSDLALDVAEVALCKTQGKRIAQLAIKLIH
jgi:NAD(P)H dehydrogenase (quinone)